MKTRISYQILQKVPYSSLGTIVASGLNTWLSSGAFKLHLMPLALWPSYHPGYISGYHQEGLLHPPVSPIDIILLTLLWSTYDQPSQC